MDFVGSSSVNFSAYVVSGVATTFDTLSPLFLLLGIPIAFMIGSSLINIINIATGFRQKAFDAELNIDNMNYVIDEDEEFFKRNGRSGSQFDLPNIRDKV